jgi:hypothetical protein
MLGCSLAAAAALAEKHDRFVARKRDAIRDQVTERVMKRR